MAHPAPARVLCLMDRCLMDRRSAHILLIVSAAALVAVLAAAFPLAANAHGFGERYDLPLPLSLFVIAGAAAVVLSFVVAAVFLRAGTAHAGYPRYNLLRLAPVRWLASPPITSTLKTLSVALTAYVIVGALIGSERAALNPAPAAIYVAFWVGLSFFTALFGNLWALVNPWKATWGFLERAFETVSGGGRLSLHRRYPARIGPWPAVLVFVGFAILETVAADAAGPRALGWILVLYSLYNFVGMYVYGREVWLRNAEGFTVVYGFMSRFSVTEVRSPTSRCRRCSSNGRCSAGETDCVDCYECYAAASPPQRQFNLRPPCVGLNRLGVVTLTVVFHVILLLSTVSFDGLSATPEWLVFTGQFLLQFPLYGGYVANLIGALGLPVVFGLLFALTCAAMAALSGQAEPDTGQLLRRFTFSLLPIALAYHFAHFLGFLLINGQRFIVLASDPFGWGWDLFGTADAIINIGILSPVFIWYFSILAIVVGHIAGVYLAHVQATRTYPTRRGALLSQAPMLVLMVCYTCASLWIISRPISE